MEFRRIRPEAVRWYRMAAEQGEAAAQYTLGLACRKGDGAPKDPVEAARWFRLAAEQGDVEAQYQSRRDVRPGRGGSGGLGGVGAVVPHGGRAGPRRGSVQSRLDVRVRRRSRQGPVGGRPVVPHGGRAGPRRGSVQPRLDVRAGRGSPQDPAEAVRWCRLAAEQGYAVAQFNLGELYALGEGVPQDPAEAVRWFRLAAEQGYAAQYALGVRHGQGKRFRRIRRRYSSGSPWRRSRVSPTASVRGLSCALNGFATCETHRTRSCRRAHEHHRQAYRGKEISVTEYGGAGWLAGVLVDPALARGGITGSVPSPRPHTGSPWRCALAYTCGILALR